MSEEIKKIDEEIKKLEEKKKELENPPEKKENIEEIIESTPVTNPKNKGGSFAPVILIMVASLLIASLWDRVGEIKNSVHFVLDPSAGALLNWNLNWGMLILIVIITIITTLVQKYATDQKKLKELKAEQKEIQKQIKEFKSDPKKMMELQKKQFQLMPQQMKLSMRALAYTGIPFILFFRWFSDYFAVAGNPKLWLGMSWFLFYLLGAIILGSILRKKMDVV